MRYVLNLNTAICTVVLLTSATVHADEKPHVYPHRNTLGKERAAATVGANPKHWGGGMIYNPSGYYPGRCGRPKDGADSPKMRQQRERQVRAAKMRKTTQTEVKRIKERINFAKRYPGSYGENQLQRMNRELEAARQEAYKYDKREPAHSPTFHYSR